MATTVGSHSVSAFATPVNGGPLDANVVRGNDNTIRTAYVAHDADTGIHVQSSSLASRPSAGTAGRKWITVDTGVYKLWYDDGTTWHEVAAGNIDVFVIADEALAKGDVVKITGYNTGTGAPRVAKVSSASDVAFGIITSTTIANGATGYLSNTGLVIDVNTAAFSIGDILYPNTSGGFTATKPTSGNYQTVAFVLRSNTNNGVLYVEFSAPRIVERSNNQASTIVLRDASGDFAAGTITATAVNTTTIDLTNLEVTNIKAKDGTASATIADSTGVMTIGSSVLTTTDINGGTIDGATIGGSSPAAGTFTTATVSGDLTVDTSTLKVDSTNNRVGIGTATPNGPLDVQRTRSDTSGNVAIQLSDVARYGFRIDTGNKLNVDSYNGATWSSPLTLDLSGNLAVDTNTLYVDATNNRVGIGTASPASQLHVSNATGTAVTMLQLQTAWSSPSGNKSIVWTDATAPLGRISVSYDASTGSKMTFGSLFSGGYQTSDLMTLDASGNLGLGVTPSAWNPTSQRVLQLGAGAATGAAVSDNGGNYGQAQNAFIDTGGWKYYANGTASLFSQSGTGGFNWYNAPSGTAGNAITFTQAMTLDASGNLGVGVSPSYKLHIEGSTAVKDNLLLQRSGSSLYLTVARYWNGTGNPLTGGAKGDILAFGNQGGDPLVFATNDTERARITSVGLLLVNTTSTALDGRISVYAPNETDYPAYFRSTSATYTGTLITGDTTRAADVAFNLIKMSGNGVEQFRVRGDGTIYAQNTTVQSVSDARLKDNVVDATDGLAVISALRPVRYDWKPGYGNDRVNQLGFIAQEVEAVFPEAVSEWAMDEPTGEVDEDGKPITEKVDYKTVGPGALIPVLVKAIQELEARIAVLEAGA